METAVAAEVGAAEVGGLDHCLPPATSFSVLDFGFFPLLEFFWKAPDATNHYGISPLILAAINGSDALVRSLLKAGADPNLSTPTEETPVMWAGRTGIPETVRRGLNLRSAPETAAVLREVMEAACVSTELEPLRASNASY